MIKAEIHLDRAREGKAMFPVKLAGVPEVGEEIIVDCLVKLPVIVLKRTWVAHDVTPFLKLEARLKRLPQ